MPQLIQYIDEIARDKKRDVLFLRFGIDKGILFNYERSSVRKKILAWLDCSAIPYVECSSSTSATGGDWYLGEIYLDISFDNENEKYRKLADYLEDENGVVKHKNVGFYIYPYKSAIEVVPRIS